MTMPATGNRDGYAGLKPYVLSDDILYGPIPTRRTGLSLGINLLPMGVKVCSFNCAYCQCGWTTIRPAEVEAKGLAYPSVERIASRCGEGFRSLAASGAIPDTITLSGNGEPTLHPAFDRAVDAVLRSRDAHLPGARVTVLSDGTELHRPEVVRGLNRLDERHMKLDAGDAATHKRIDIPLVPFDLDDYVDRLRGLRDVVVQAFFCRGRIDNTGGEAVAAWLERVKLIRPSRVDLYSLDRIPAAEGLERVSAGDLETLAAKVREAGVPAEVY
jgi:wyosine [tRNA(Phe)-imidazoG37] synthetase (radical SAM superfamily)